MKIFLIIMLCFFILLPSYNNHLLQTLQADYNRYKTDLMSIQEAINGIAIYYHHNLENNNFRVIGSYVAQNCNAKVLTIRSYNEGDLQFIYSDQYDISNLNVQKVIDTKQKSFGFAPTWDHQCVENDLFVNIYYTKKGWPKQHYIQFLSDEAESKIVAITNGQEESSQIVKIPQQEFDQINQISILVIYKFKYSKTKAFKIENFQLGNQQTGYYFMAPPSQSHISQSFVQNNKLQAVYLQFEDKDYLDQNSEQQNPYAMDQFMHNPILFFVQIKIGQNNKDLQVKIFQVTSSMDKQNFDQQLFNECNYQDTNLTLSDINFNIELRLNNSNSGQLLDSYQEVVQFEKKAKIKRNEQKNTNNNLIQNPQNNEQTSFNQDFNISHQNQEATSNQIQNNQNNQAPQNIVPIQKKVQSRPQIQRTQSQPNQKPKKKTNQRKRSSNQQKIPFRPVFQPPRSYKRYSKGRQLLGEEKVVIQRYMFSSIPLRKPQGQCTIRRSFIGNFQKLDIQVMADPLNIEQNSQTKFHIQSLQNLQLQNYMPLNTQKHLQPDQNLQIIAENDEKFWISLEIQSPQRINLRQKQNGSDLVLACNLNKNMQQNQTQNLEQAQSVQIKFFDSIDQFNTKPKQKNQKVFLYLYNQAQGFRENYNLNNVKTCNFVYSQEGQVQIQLYPQDKEVHKFQAHFDQNNQLNINIFDQDGQNVLSCMKNLFLKKNSRIFIEYQYLQTIKEKESLLTLIFDSQINGGMIAYNDFTKQIKNDECLFDTTAYEELGFIQVSVFDQSFDSSSFNYIKVYFLKDDFKIFIAKKDNGFIQENIYNLQDLEKRNHKTIDSNIVQKFDSITPVGNFQSLDGSAKFDVIQRFQKENYDDFQKSQMIMYLGQSYSDQFQMQISEIGGELYFFIFPLSNNQQKSFFAQIFDRDEDDKLQLTLVNFSKDGQKVLVENKHFSSSRLTGLWDFKIDKDDIEKVLNFQTCYKIDKKNQECNYFKEQKHNLNTIHNIIVMILIPENQNSGQIPDDQIDIAKWKLNEIREQNEKKEEKDVTQIKTTFELDKDQKII